MSKALSYEQAWKLLDDLQFFKIKLGLDSMADLLGRLGNPQKNLRVIHIAGTNGKGSTGATLLAILTAAGYQTGFYTSPHLSDVRERFRIGERFMDREVFTRLMSRIVDVLAGDQITYFECATALALLWFAEEQVDFAILEVGMGGRLDATNVVTPLAGIITNVSMDHEQYLGDTIEKIAMEKAGIIKPGIPLVSAVSGGALEPVRQRCEELGSPLNLLGRDFWAKQTGRDRWGFSSQHEELQDLSLTLRGGHQVENAALALACLEHLQEAGFAVSEQAIRQGLTRVFWPGRLEEFWLDSQGLVRRQAPDDRSSIRYLLDGAHNQAGIAALSQALHNDFSFRNLILVWAAMEDKDLRAPLTTIMPLASHIIFTRPVAERAAAPELLQSLLSQDTRGRSHCSDTVEDGLTQAAALCGPEDLICVAGSLYLVGKARKILLGELVAE